VVGEAGHAGRWPDVGDRWPGEDGGWAQEQRAGGRATTVACRWVHGRVGAQAGEGDGGRCEHDGRREKLDMCGSRVAGTRLWLSVLTSIGKSQPTAAASS
jgi:hypothetical protein